MAARDPWAERYNRRTRAIEAQAQAERMKVDALDRIAAALELQAIATAAGTKVPTPATGRVWTQEYATKLQQKISALVAKVAS